MEAKMKCPVCFEDVPSSRRVECFCGYSLCRNCCQRWISDKADQPFCLECGEVWLFSFLYEKLGTWMRGSKKGSFNDHLKNLLVEKAKAKMGEVYQIIEEMGFRRTLPSKLRMEECVKSFLEKGSDSMTVVFPCSVDGCKGGVNLDYRCVVCETEYCPDCREKKHKGKCDSKVVKTVKKIRNSSRACPKCAVNITKSEGCNQMWCTRCHVFFDYASGKLLSSTSAHNPHAIQWMRENGRLPRERGDVICGGIPDQETIKKAFSADSFKEDPVMKRVIGTVITYARSMAEYIDDRTTQQGKIEDTEIKDFIHRIYYVLGRIDLHKLRNTLYCNYRVRMRLRVKLEILETLHQNAVPYFRQLIEDLNRLGPPNRLEILQVCYRFFENINLLREFLNDSMRKELPKLGSTRPPQIRIYGWILGSTL